MRQQLANLFWLSALSGCSLIYNPNNLDDPQADAAIDSRPIDAPFIDANPDNLGIESVEPAFINEGQGAGSSQPGVFVIRGHDILGTATIAFDPVDDNVNIEIIGDPVVGLDANWIAVVVKVDVNPMTTTTEMTDVAVTLSQNSGGITMPTTWRVKNLPELVAADVDAANKLPATLAPLYSRVDLTGVPAGPIFAGGTAPVIIRSVTDINIPNDIQASAPFVYDALLSRQTSGPGGVAGGGRGSPGAGMGAGGAATSAGKGGGGGGFAAPGEAGADSGGAGGAEHGSRFIASYASNTSGGGAGGTDGVAIGTIMGGVGGGSGGIVELTAGGALSIAGITADGASGSAGQNAGTTQTSGGGGGGGGGGLVLLRAGGSLMVNGTLSVAGGAGGAGGSNSGGGLGTAGTKGGTGAAGRIRFDTATPAATVPGATRGVYIAPTATRIFNVEMPTFQVRGLQGTEYTFQIAEGRTNTTPSGPQTMGANEVPIKPTIGLGYNRLCVVVQGGVSTNDEAANCVGIVGMPTGN